MAAQQDERKQAPGRPRVRRWWQDNGICPPLAVKEKEGRGGGVFTTEDLKCGTEVLPPIAPLACALMSDVRGCYCDYCFKSVEDCGKSVSACIARLILCETTLCRPLRRCSRCRFAYYCSKACQVMSCFQCSYWHKTPTHTHTTHTHTHTHTHTPHTHTHMQNATYRKVTGGLTNTSAELLSRKLGSV